VIRDAPSTWNGDEEPVPDTGWPTRGGRGADTDERTTEGDKPERQTPAAHTVDTAVLVAEVPLPRHLPRFHGRVRGACSALLAEQGSHRGVVLDAQSACQSGCDAAIACRKVNRATFRTTRCSCNGLVTELLPCEAAGAALLREKGTHCPFAARAPVSLSQPRLPACSR
jgi:hypothetical protein